MKPVPGEAKISLYNIKEGQNSQYLTFHFLWVRSYSLVIWTSFVEENLCFYLNVRHPISSTRWKATMKSSLRVLCYHFLLFITNAVEKNASKFVMFSLLHSIITWSAETLALSRKHLHNLVLIPYKQRIYAIKNE